MCVLHSFLDFSAPQASGADPNTFRLAVDQRSDWLEIGLEDPLGFVVGMTDVVSRAGSFPAYSTDSGHLSSVLRRSKR